MGLMQRIGKEVSVCCHLLFFYTLFNGLSVGLVYNYCIVGANGADFADFDETDFNDFFRRTDIRTMTTGENAERALAEFESYEEI